MHVSGATVSEVPTEGSTEEWVIIYLTGDTRPIHLHIVQFQFMSRQKINAAKYQANWHLLNAAGSATGMPSWDNA
jgi:FtsP/CotA-like multicopper oxidase with cupredoxin domain